MTVDVSDPAPGRSSRGDLMQRPQAATADLEVAGDILARQTLHIHEVQNALGHSLCGSRQAPVVNVAVRQPICCRCKSNKCEGKLSQLC